jgi:ADP-ribosylation factor GTPase-activating protein 2/3
LFELLFESSTFGRSCIVCSVSSTWPRKKKKNHKKKKKKKKNNQKKKNLTQRHMFSSTTLDAWKRGELRLMELGGNARARAFFRQHGVDDSVKSDDKKYHSRAAELYRAQLKREVYEQKQASASSALPDAAFPEVSEEERLAAINKLKLEEAVAAAKQAVASGEKAAPLKLSVSTDDDDKILASKQVVDKSKSLGATKVSGSAFDDFDAEEEEEPAAPAGGATGSGDNGAVTRADLAALAEESASSTSSAAPAAAAEKPRGRPMISSRLQYVDEEDERKAQQNAPRGAALAIDVSQRSYDDKPAASSSTRTANSGGGKGGGASDRHDARDRFSNAKAISSSQFFNEDGGSKVSKLVFVFVFWCVCDDDYIDGLL